MMEVIEGFPDTVLAFSARGRVTKKDYEDVLVPAVETALGRRDKLRLYYELGPAFSGIEPGAMWEDFKVGIGHWSRWGRVAVVTDVEWIRHAVNAFRFVMPDQARVFSNADANEARDWIAA